MFIAMEFTLNIFGVVVAVSLLGDFVFVFGFGFFLKRIHFLTWTHKVLDRLWSELDRRQYPMALPDCFPADSVDPLGCDHQYFPRVTQMAAQKGSGRGSARDPERAAWQRRSEPSRRCSRI